MIRSYLTPFVTAPLLTILLPLLLEGQGAPAGGMEDLSLEDAIHLARIHNPGHWIHRDRAELGDWDVRAAYGQWLPSADASTSVSWLGPGEQRFGTVTTEQLGLEGLPSFYASSYSLGVAFTLDGERWTAVPRARAQREARHADLRDSEARLARSVTSAYLDVLRAVEALHLARIEADRAAHDRRLAQERAAVGAETELAVQRARVTEGRARAQILRAEEGVEVARLELARRLGVSLDPEIRLTTSFSVTELEWGREELIGLALEENPALEALRANRRAAREEVRTARSAYFPSLTLQAGLSAFTQQASSVNFLADRARSRSELERQQCQALNELFRRLADPLPPQDCSVFRFTEQDLRAIEERNRSFPFDFTAQPPQVSLTVSLPLFRGLGRQRELESARVRQREVRHRIREQELALEAEIGAALSAVRTSHRRARLEEENREVAERHLHLVREEFEVGAVSFLEVTEASALLRRAEREQLEAVYDHHEALARLESVVGAPLRDSRREDRP